MNRIKAIRKNRKLHKKLCRVMGCFLITLLLLCGTVGNLFAKYYAGQSNKGVATASGLYFASNVLNTLPVSETPEYPLVFNQTPWDGTGTCSMEVDIRNYQNQLLYNDANLDITYNVTFKLVETTDGGSYTVTNISDASGQQNTQTITGAGVTFQNLTLEGGRQNQHRFTVNVTRPESQKTNPNYRSVGIQVTATPVSPSYVANAITLGGILYANTFSASYSLDCKFNLDANTGLSSYSGFPCTISYTPDEDQTPHEVKISWRADVLEIDRHDPYYLQLKDDNAKYGKETVEGATWQYMKITMQPYSKIQMIFYRGSGFNDSTVTLSQCVKVEDLSRSSTTTGGSGE